MLTRSGKVIQSEPVKGYSTSTSNNEDDQNCSASCSTADVTSTLSKSSSKPTTRSTTYFWLIGQPSASISGAKLPTCRQVIKYFLYLRHNPENVKKGLSNEEIAYSVADSVEVFWQMARIKTKYRQNCMLDVMALYQEWVGLSKHRDRLSDPGEKRQKYTLNLDCLFDIGAPVAIEEILKSKLLSSEQREEDIMFYNDQKSERKAVMSGHDKIFEKKVDLNLSRKRRMKLKSESETLECPADRSTQGESDSDDNDESDVRRDIAEVDADFNIDERCGKHNSVTLNFPRKIMQCEQITEAGDRLKLSDNQVTMIVSSVLKAAGGDLDQFDISRSTTRRNRMANRLKLADSVIDKVRENPPRFCALHWDGKLLADMRGESCERLAVLISGAPNYTEGKLLGVPSLTDSTGKSQADASYDLLNVWGLVDNIIALVFDTTASNTAVKKGAAKLLEEKIGRKLLLLACRHHVDEVIIGGVWKLLFGKTVGPENQLFLKFKRDWKQLDKEKAVKTLSITNPWLKKRRDDVVHELTKLLSGDGKKAMPRDDYRECAENALIILSHTCSNDARAKKPGAMHHARWMACNLYAGKMFMYSEQMHYDSETVDKLERLNVFLQLFYVPLWLKATSACDAPILDLELFHDMMDFRTVDSEIADIVLKKLTNHRWYLTEEILPFALFSNHPAATSEVKQAIATKVLATPVPENFRLGRPVFRDITRESTLADLIGPESLTLFRSLNISTSWLAAPVTDWSGDPDFIVAEEFVKSVKVTNDAAERGVKLISDFACNITTDPHQRAALLHCVEHHRRQFPSFEKKLLSTM